MIIISTNSPRHKKFFQGQSMKMTFKSISKLSLLAKFTIVSFIITAVIGISLGWVIQQQMVQNELEHASKEAADHVITIMDWSEPHFVDNQLRNFSI